jgi:phage terminase small subunit
MALTEKMKSFCREYFSNGGNATQAYLFAYNSDSEVAAANEGSLLLQRDDIQEYLCSLNKPLEEKAISERERKRALLWERIDYCIKTNNDNAVARYMDILNKMDSEYININRNIEDNGTQLEGLTIDQLKKLSDA